MPKAKSPKDDLKKIKEIFRDPDLREGLERVGVKIRIKDRHYVKKTVDFEESQLEIINALRTKLSITLREILYEALADWIEKRTKKSKADNT